MLAENCFTRGCVLVLNLAILIQLSACSRPEPPLSTEFRKEAAGLAPDVFNFVKASQSLDLPEVNQFGSYQNVTTGVFGVLSHSVTGLQRFAEINENETEKAVAGALGELLAQTQTCRLAFTLAYQTQSTASGPSDEDKADQCQRDLEQLVPVVEELMRRNDVPIRK